MPILQAKKLRPSEVCDLTMITELEIGRAKTWLYMCLTLNSCTYTFNLMF